MKDHCEICRHRVDCLAIENCVILTNFLEFAVDSLNDSAENAREMLPAELEESIDSYVDDFRATLIICEKMGINPSDSLKTQINNFESNIEWLRVLLTERLEADK